MRVRFHGVRGSCPVPGTSTVRYGGNSVCVSVRTLDDSLIILDAGTGIRELGNQLVKGPLPSRIHLLITHAHWDHIMGLPFFAPLWRKDAHHVFHSLSPRARSALARQALFDGEHFPVRFEDIPSVLERTTDDVDRARIGSATVRSIALNHPGGCDGYRIDDADGSSLCYLTDNELTPPGPMVTTPTELARFAERATVLIHDAQYLPSDMPAKRGWGHSLVGDVLDLARRAEARVVALHHHDPDRDDDALDRIAADTKSWTADHAPSLTAHVAREGLDLTLSKGELLSDG